MLLSDSQMSMRPLGSELLFKPVNCIFVTCLMRFMSWKVGFKSIPCSSDCICIIIPLLSFYFEGVI